MDRKTELQTNLAQVQAQISAACQKYGRDPNEVTLIVVTKTWPASDVSLLAELGVTDVGENRDQEGKVKHEEVQHQEITTNLTWHAIGQLQTNKAKSVANWADVVHSVDRIELVQALAKTVVQRSRPLKCLIQVNLDPNPRAERGGALPDEVQDLAKQITSTPNLELAGVMGVAPLDEDPQPAFAKLAKISSDLISRYPSATWISAGMSGDYELAIKNGATHLRIGSSILGHRPVNG